MFSLSHAEGDRQLKLRELVAATVIDPPVLLCQHRTASVDDLKVGRPRGLQCRSSLPFRLAPVDGDSFGSLTRSRAGDHAGDQCEGNRARNDDQACERPVSMLEWDRYSLQRSFDFHVVEFPSTAANVAEEKIFLFCDPTEEVVKMSVAIAEDQVERPVALTSLASSWLYLAQTDDVAA